MEDVFKEHEGMINESLKNSSELIDKIECHISPLFFGENLKEDQSYELIVDTAKILSAYLKQEIKNIGQMNKTEKN